MTETESIALISVTEFNIIFKGDELEKITKKEYITLESHEIVMDIFVDKETILKEMRENWFHRIDENMEINDVINALHCDIYANMMRSWYKLSKVCKDPHQAGNLESYIKVFNEADNGLTSSLLVAIVNRFKDIVPQITPIPDWINLVVKTTRPKLLKSGGMPNPNTRNFIYKGWTFDQRVDPRDSSGGGGASVTKADVTNFYLQLYTDVEKTTGSAVYTSKFDPYFGAFHIADEYILDSRPIITKPKNPAFAPTVIEKDTKLMIMYTDINAVITQKIDGKKTADHIVSKKTMVEEDHSLYKYESALTDSDQTKRHEYPGTKCTVDAVRWNVPKLIKDLHIPLANKTIKPAVVIQNVEEYQDHDNIDPDAFFDFIREGNSLNLLNIIKMCKLTDLNQVKRILEAFGLGLSSLSSLKLANIGQCKVNKTSISLWKNVRDILWSNASKVKIIRAPVFKQKESLILGNTSELFSSITFPKTSRSYHLTHSEMYEKLSSLRLKLSVESMPDSGETLYQRKDRVYTLRPLITGIEIDRLVKIADLRNNAYRRLNFSEIAKREVREPIEFDYFPGFDKRNNLKSSGVSLADKRKRKERKAFRNAKDDDIRYPEGYGFIGELLKNFLVKHQGRDAYALDIKDIQSLLYRTSLRQTDYRDSLRVPVLSFMRTRAYKNIKGKYSRISAYIDYLVMLVLESSIRALADCYTLLRQNSKPVVRTHVADFLLELAKSSDLNCESMTALIFGETAPGTTVFTMNRPNFVAAVGPVSKHTKSGQTIPATITIGTAYLNEACGAMPRSDGTSMNNAVHQAFMYMKNKRLNIFDRAYNVSDPIFTGVESFTETFDVLLDIYQTMIDVSGQANAYQIGPSLRTHKYTAPKTAKKGSTMTNERTIESGFTIKAFIEDRMNHYFPETVVTTTFKEPVQLQTTDDMCKELDFSIRYDLEYYSSGDSDKVASHSDKAARHDKRFFRQYSEFCDPIGNKSNKLYCTSQFIEIITNSNVKSFLWRFTQFNPIFIKEITAESYFDKDDGFGNARVCIGDVMEDQTIAASPIEQFDLKVAQSKYSALTAITHKKDQSKLKEQEQEQEQEPELSAFAESIIKTMFGHLKEYKQVLDTPEQIEEYCTGEADMDVIKELHTFMDDKQHVLCCAHYHSSVGNIGLTMNHKLFKNMINILDKTSLTLRRLVRYIDEWKASIVVSDRGLDDISERYFRECHLVNSDLSLDIKTKVSKIEKIVTAAILEIEDIYTDIHRAKKDDLLTYIQEMEAKVNTYSHANHQYRILAKIDMLIESISKDEKKKEKQKQLLESPAYLREYYRHNLDELE